MTPEQLKQAAAVMLAAAEGRKVQFRALRSNCMWSNPVTPTHLSWDWDSREFRIAPETVKSRRYLARMLSGSATVSALNSAESRTVDHIESMPHFIRWIDTDWQEHEV